MDTLHHVGLKLVIYGEMRVGDRWVLAEPWVDNAGVTEENYWMISAAERIPRQLCWGDPGLWRIFTGHFAGADSAPIVAPRGLPDDLSEDLKAFWDDVDYFEGEGPSDASGWIAMTELLDFDWNATAPANERQLIRTQLDAWGVDPNKGSIAFDVEKWIEEEAIEVAGRRWRDLVRPDFFEAIARLRQYAADADLRVVFTVGY